MTADNEQFQKFDDEKPNWDLLMVDLNAQVEGMVKVLTHGAKTYEARNWQKAKSQSDRRRLIASLFRHMNQYISGNLYDQDSFDKDKYKEPLRNLEQVAVIALFLQWREDQPLGFNCEPEIV